MRIQLKLIPVGIFYIISIISMTKTQSQKFALHWIASKFVGVSTWAWQICAKTLQCGLHDAQHGSVFLAWRRLQSVRERSVMIAQKWFLRFSVFLRCWNRKKTAMMACQVVSRKMKATSRGKSLHNYVIFSILRCVTTCHDLKCNEMLFIGRK